MYKLYSCVWEITLACCFSCKYCGSGAGRKRENELSLEECLDVAEQLSELGCRRVSMIGGEVFMRSDWREIVGALTSRGIKVCIITNGFVFSEEYIEDLKKLRIESVAVSIDGIRAVHDKYRQEGSFDRAIDAVRKLGESGIPVSVISTLNSENASGLYELLSVLKNEPIWAWQLQACSPMGNASGINYSFDFKQVIDFVLDNREKVPFSLGIADNIGYFTEGEGKLRGGEDVEFSGCGAGITSIGIDSVGNVRGCEAMYDDCFIEGNIRERRLKEIWEDETAFFYNRGFTTELLTGACRECPEGGYCAGGCRSYNYFVHGKMYESPFCARVKNK